MVKKASKTHFSVLMSVYSKEKPEYFDAALNSVLDQTLMPSEIVICEDGPITDELKSVIKKYKQKFPKIVRSISFPENRGLGLTLRDGVLACKNEIIFRMDTDDISVKDRFEKQLKVFLEKDVDVLGSNIDEYDENMEKYTGSRIVPEKNDDIIAYSKMRNPLNHMTVVFSKKSIVDAGNYMDCCGFEDYYLWIRMIKKGFKFYNMQKSLVMTRCGATMTRRRGGRKYSKNVRNFYKKIYEEGYIDAVHMHSALIRRYTVLLCPNVIRRKIYDYLLREKTYGR